MLSGYWNCTDANLLGSDCDLVCMIGHMTTPNMGSKNSCRGMIQTSSFFANIVD